MRVAIDCFKLAPGTGKSRGIYNFSRRLISALAARRQDLGLDVVVLGTRHNRHDFAPPGVEFIEVDRSPFSRVSFTMWELFAVNRHLRQASVDLCVFPRGFLPIRPATSSIIVVHDLIPFYYHEHHRGYFPFLESVYIRRRLIASARGANAVATVSNYTAAELRKRLPPPHRRKVATIHNGYAPALGPKPKPPAAPYILSISSPLPHKNLGGLLAGYAAYTEEADDPLPLVVVGPERPAGAASVVPPRVLERITFTGFVSDERLSELVTGATVFLFLSLIEGFGYPPLEAMARGVPVIVSRGTSLSEVVGDAGLLVDPGDSPAIAEALSAVLSDRTLQDDLRTRGFDNLSRFDWGERAADYARLMRRVIAEAPSQ